MSLRELLAFALLASAAFSVTIIGSPDKSIYTTSDSITYLGYVLLNSTGVNGSTVTISLGGAANTSVTNGSGYYSVAMPNPGVAGDYNINATVSYGGATWYIVSPIKVVAFSNLFVWANKDTYSSGDNVTVSVRAEDAAGNGVDYAVNVTVWKFENGSASSLLASASGSTGSDGVIEFANITMVNDSGEYRVFVNNWMASDVFTVSTFVVTLTTYDTNGNTVYTFGAGDAVNITATTLTSTGTTVSAVVSGAVTLPNGTVSTLTSTTTTGGRASFNFNTSITGTYTVELTAVRGTETRSIGTRFEVQSYLVEVFPAMTTQGPKSGFFPGESVAMSLRVLDMTTKTEVTSIPTGQISASVYRGSTVAINSSLVSVGTNPTESLYTLSFTAPTTQGRYDIIADVNYSGSTGRGYGSFVVQTSYATATIVDESGSPKKMVQAGKTLYVRLDVRNSTTTLNVSGVSLEALYREMDDVKGDVNASTISFNSSSSIYSFTLPNKAGPYYIRLDVNTTTGQTVLAETFFFAKLYDIIAMPYKSGVNITSGFGPFGFFSFKSTDTIGLNITVRTASLTGKEFGAFGGNFMGGGGPQMGDGGGAPPTGPMSTKEGTDSGASTQNTAGGGGFGGGAFSGGGGFGAEGTPVQGATITVDSVFSPDTFEDVTSKVTVTVAGVTDTSGQTSLTIRHTSQWTGGFYIVRIKVTDANGGEDIGEAFFEVRNYMVWANVMRAGATSGAGGGGRMGDWIVGSSDNINVTITVTDPQNWQGVENASVNVTRILYEGKPGKFVWPPKVVNITSQNCTTTGGSGWGGGSCSVTISAPAGGWDSGFHRIVISASKNVSGTVVSDTGMGFFETKIFMMIVEPVGWRFTYPPSYSPQFNVTVQYTNMTKVQGATLRVSSIKRVSDWPPTDLNTSAYSAPDQTTNADGNAILTINPTGSWGSFDYVAVVEASKAIGNATVTDSWMAFFQVRAFYSQLQPTVWAFQPTANITFTAIASKTAPWAIWSGAAVDPDDYINANLSRLSVRRWDQSTWRESDVTSAYGFNLSTTSVNGIANISLTHTVSLPTGGYMVAVTFTDASGNEQVAQSWFEVQAFQFEAWPQGWSFSPGDNVTISVFAFSPGSYGMGSNYTSNVTVNVTAVRRADTWPPQDISGSLWNTTGTVILANTGGSSLSISLGSGVSPGQYMATVAATDGSANQSRDVWFRVETFRLETWATSWAVQPNQNVTVMARAYKGVGESQQNLSLGVVNATLRGWQESTGQPVTQAITNFTASYDNATGLTNITLIPSPSWPMGGFDVELVLMELTSGTNATATGHVWFSVRPFELNGWPTKWKYMPGENVTLYIEIRTADWREYTNPVNVSVSSIRRMPGFATVNSSLYNASVTAITSTGNFTVTPNAGFPASGDFLITMLANDSAAGLYATRDFFVSVGSYEVWLRPLQQMYSSSQNLTFEVNAWSPADGQQVNASSVTAVQIMQPSQFGMTTYTVTNYTYDNSTRILTIPQPIGAVNLTDDWYNLRIETLALVQGQSVASSGMGGFRISSGLQVTATVDYGSNTGRNDRAFGPLQNATFNVTITSSSGDATVTFHNASLRYNVCTPGSPVCNDYQLPTITIGRNITNSGTLTLAPPSSAWPLEFWTHYWGDVWYSTGSRTEPLFVEFDVTGALTGVSDRQSYALTEAIPLNVTVLAPNGSNEQTPVNVSIAYVRYWPPAQQEQNFPNFTSTVSQTVNGTARVIANLTGGATWPPGWVGLIACASYANNSRACEWFGVGTQQQSLQLMNFIVIGLTGINQTFNLTTTVVNPTDAAANDVYASVVLPSGITNQSNTTQSLGILSAGGNTSVTFQLKKVSAGNWNVEIRVNSSNLGSASMFGLIGDATPPLVLNVTPVANVTFAVITVVTDEPANTTFRYGTNALNLSSTGRNTTRTTSNTLVITGLAPSTAYYYNVTACDAGGNCNTTASSLNSNFTTAAETAPAISNVSAVTGPNFAAITWATDVASNSTVRYGTGSEGNLTLNRMNATSSIAHTVYLTNLTANTTYYYNVTSCGYSLCTTDGPRNFTTQAVPPAPPNLTATITNPANSSTTGNTTLLSVSTNPAANCTYGTNPASLGPMANTNNILHNQTLTFTSNGSVFLQVYYVNCSTSNQSVLTNVTWNVDTAPPVINGSSVQSTSVNATAQNVTWTTNEVSNSTVRYWNAFPPVGDGTVAINATTDTSHTVYITGLSAGTYYYLVQSMDQYQNMGQFPAQGQPLPNFTKP